MKFQLYYYLHMPIGMLRIYRLLFVCFFSLSAGFLVMDIYGVGWRRAMKFGRMVDLEVYQSPLLVNFGPRGLAP